MLIKLFSFLGLIGVCLGAFGAHALKAKLTPVSLENWKTATLYLFIHVLAGLFAANIQNSKSAFCFLIGILFFSGSLYTLSLTNIKIFGAITPIGGIFFILGWALLFLKGSS